MADFCNFCNCNDIDYQEIINKNFNSILENMYSPPNEGKVYVYGGICEGCSMSGIVVSQKYDGVFEIHSADTLGMDLDNKLGKLVASNKKNVLIEKVKNYNHWLIDIDEDSYLFKNVYRKKKESASISKKTMLREFEAAKHIAYALYMIGDKPGYVSLHDCVSFEDFDVDIMKTKRLNNKAWGLLQYYYDKPSRKPSTLVVGGCQQNEYEYEKYK